MGEPPQDLGALVVDDAVRLLVPQERHAVLPLVRGVVSEVQLVHEAAVEEVVGRSAGVRLVEAPSWFAFGVGPDDGDGEYAGEVFEMSDEVGAVGEGAEEAFVWLAGENMGRSVVCQVGGAHRCISGICLSRVGIGLLLRSRHASHRRFRTCESLGMSSCICAL